MSEASSSSEINAPVSIYVTVLAETNLMELISEIYIFILLRS